MIGIWSCENHKLYCCWYALCSLAIKFMILSFNNNLLYFLGVKEGLLLFSLFSWGRGHLCLTAFSWGASACLLWPHKDLCSFILCLSEFSVWSETQFPCDRASWFLYKSEEGEGISFHVMPSTCRQSHWFPYPLRHNIIKKMFLFKLEISM